MNSDLKKFTLGEACNILTGFPFKGENYSTVGVRVLRGENVTVGNLRWDTIKCWSLAFNENNKYSLQEGDIVIGMDGSRVGKNRAQIRKEDLPLLLAQRVARLRANGNFSQDFLFYVIRSDNFESYINGIKTGTSIPHISAQQIKEFVFYAPNKETQIRIANILRSIDDKIELNRQTNVTLEAIAQAIFREWFVDFNYPGATGEMVESELGKIPRTWHVGKLKDVSALRNERITASFETEKMPYVPIDVISSHSLFLSEYKSGVEAKTSLIKFYRGDILFGAMRPYFHKVCIAPFDGTTRTTAFVLFPVSMLDYSYVVMLLNQPSTIEYASNHSSGSTIPYVQWTNSLEDMPILIPAREVRERFDALTRPLLTAISQSFYEDHYLKIIRDTLLPKLINGYVTYGNYEA